MLLCLPQDLKEGEGGEHPLCTPPQFILCLTQDLKEGEGGRALLEPVHIHC